MNGFPPQACKSTLPLQAPLRLVPNPPTLPFPVLPYRPNLPCFILVLHASHVSRLVVEHAIEQDSDKSVA